MDLELENKKAFVSGSTAGIGLAIAIRLIREGADVWLNGRTQERVDEAIAVITKEIAGGNLHGIATDLGTAAGCAEVVRQLAHENKMSPEEFEKEFFKNARPTSLLKRFIEPDEIASVVAFVCSPLAAAINGASVRADGGVIKSIA